MLKNGYTLDVCSPGLDRELRNNEEFSWAVGKEVKVTLHSPVEGKSAITGKLEKVNGEGNIVIEEDEGVRITLERKNIAKAKLWVKI
jgi:ribosome maturation factor RimP